MKKTILIVGLAATVLVGCNTVNQKQYNLVTEVPAGYTAKQVENAIIETGKARRWKITNAGSGRLMATQSVAGGISAKTEVTYSGRSYSFKLLSSTGLRQTETSAHRRYNSWIHKWNDDIKLKLKIQ